MSKVSTNISLDKDLKDSANKLFLELGLNLSSAITLFLHQAVLEQRIPFIISKEIPTAETLEALKEFEEMKTNKEKYKRYSSFKEILKEAEECSESSDQTDSSKM